MNANSAPAESHRASGVIASLQKNCDEIANMKANDIQHIAGVLQKMIVSYYQDVRRQALLAFFAALVLEVVAVMFFIYAASLTMNGNDQTKAALFAAAGGLLIQVMTGIVFFLYSQSAKQFGGFHICLERTNRFLLANAMVERLPESEQASKRAEVITSVVNAPMLTMSIIEGRT